MTTVTLAEGVPPIVVTMQTELRNILVTFQQHESALDLADLVTRIQALEANQLPAGTEGDILIYQGGSWVGTDTLPT